MMKKRWRNPGYLKQFTTNPEEGGRKLTVILRINIRLKEKVPRFTGGLRII